MNHFLSVQDMTTTEIMELLNLANKYRRHEYKITKQLFAANLFFIAYGS